MPPTSDASDLSRAFREDGAHKTHIGGQALLEGIMMRGKTCWSVAVRTPDEDIYLEDHVLPRSKTTQGILSLPIIRGCVAFFETLVLGYKALSISALHAFDDEEDTHDEPASKSAVSTGAPECEHKGSVDPAEPSSSHDESALPKGAITLSMALGLILGIVLFIALPAVVTNIIVGQYQAHTLLWNIVDGVLRVAIFIGYLWLIGRMSDVKRMFGYHGAEHKTIHCAEHDLPLTVENARSFPRLHVRCGTAFLITVMIIAIFVYTVVPMGPLLNNFTFDIPYMDVVLLILARIVLMPVIAGVSYEITVRWAGSHPDNPLVKVVLWPGMQLQYLTTREPDDGQLECAIAAMQAVLAHEKLSAS